MSRSNHGWRYLFFLIPVAAVIASVAVAVAPVPDTATMAQPPGHHYVYRICPVADCSAYPDPATIRGIALSSLENWLLFERSASSQIQAVYSPQRKSWNGNCVRLQLLQDKLVGPRGNL